MYLGIANGAGNIGENLSGYDPSTQALHSAMYGWQFGGQQGLDTQRYLGGLNYAAQMHSVDAPLAYKQGVFNRVFPWMEGLVGNKAFGLTGSKPNANLLDPTHVTQGGVYNPQQVQQQVNQSRAQQDQTTATQIQQGQNQLAGRGFGANSPLAALLQQQAHAQGNATNADNETNIRMNAANQNAQQNLSAQQAQGAINSAWNTAAVQNQTSHYNALIGLLGSFGNLV